MERESEAGKLANSGSPGKAKYLMDFPKGPLTA